MIAATADIIRIERYYLQQPAAIWRALTEPELLARWWAQGDIRAVEGHRFDLDMGPWGKQPCQIVTVDPERRLSFLFATGTLNTMITWELTSRDNGTLLTLTHEGFDLTSPLGKTALEGMKSGWPTVLERLEQVFAESLHSSIRFPNKF
jgi:uncharacterized protein YndB with AHSA1/START domain